MALIPPHFLDAVVAIGVGDDPNQRQWIGTGFLYGLYEKKIDDQTNHYIIFLITNEHVLRNQKKIWLKFNDSTGSGSVDYPVRLIATNGKKLWAQHSKADVAAFFINVNKLKSEGRTFHYFQSDQNVIKINELKDQGATEGDGVFLLGYPMGIVGAERQYVICRNGCYARVRDLLDKSSDDFLVDAFVFPGNSGGPVLTKPELTHIQGTKANNKCQLVGIVKTYIPYQDIAISNQTKRPRIIFEENTGLTAVEPVDFIEITAKTAKRRLKNRIASARWRAKRKDEHA